MFTSIVRSCLARKFSNVKLVVFAAATAAGMAIAPAARAERASGIQLTPDGGRYLISKDVGNERWAITYNLTDKTITGNVFSTAGSPPQFVFCTTVSVDQAADPTQSQYNLSCELSSVCAAAPCDSSQWTTSPPVLVTVAGSFLLPPATQSTLSGNVQPIFDASCAGSSSCHANGQTPDLLPGRSWGELYNALSREAPDVAYVKPFDAGDSYLLDTVLGTQSSGSRMPLGMTPLSDADTASIRSWIGEGAANN
jgi:hypothetical protein